MEASPLSPLAVNNLNSTFMDNNLDTPPASQVKTCPTLKKWGFWEGMRVTCAWRPVCGHICLGLGMSRLPGQRDVRMLFPISFLCSLYSLTSRKSAAHNSHVTFAVPFPEASLG